jgi:hypothetical protein
MTEEMTPAAEILAAARSVRALAEQATPGPWIAAPVWSPRSTATSAVYSAALPPGSEVVGSTRSNAVVGPTKKFGGCWRPQDAEYIALVHPVVAAGMATLLEESARAMQFFDAVEAKPDAADRVVVVTRDGLPNYQWTAALALARSITGAAAINPVKD